MSEKAGKSDASAADAKDVGKETAPTGTDVTPMEMNPAPIRTENQNGFKKLFLKLGEKVGTVKTTELSAEYLAAVKDIDAYKEMLRQLLVSMMAVLQNNPKFVPTANSAMNCECEKDQHPFETLASGLQDVKANFSEHMTSMETVIRTCTDMAAIHRECQQKGRRAMHFMRTFMNVDYPQLNEERQTLMTRREESDYAKHAFTNNPSDSNKRRYDAALARFNQQSDEVIKMLGTLSKKKEVHRLELVKFLDEMRKYHEKSYEACLKASKATW